MEILTVLKPRGLKFSDDFSLVAESPGRFLCLKNASRMPQEGLFCILESFIAIIHHRSTQNSISVGVVEADLLKESRVKRRFHEEEQCFVCRFGL